MMRYGTSPIIILINNGGYTIEVEIHDGPYNVIKNWDYVGAVKAWHNGQVGRGSEIDGRGRPLHAWVVCHQ